jgi:hypothetical protein
MSLYTTYIKGFRSSHQKWWKDLNQNSMVVAII